MKSIIAVIVAFFSRPTVAEVRQDYREQDQNRRSEVDSYKLWKFFQKQLKRIEFSAEFMEKVVDAAREYMAAKYPHVAWAHDPEAALGHARLTTVVRDPRFLLQDRALEVVRVLSRDPHCDIFGFEMWSEYTKISKWESRYVLRSGVGKDHVQAFERLVRDERLWTECSPEFRRIFFASVGQALRLLAEEQGLLQETLQARMALMANNEVHGNRHEPHCSTAFRQEEVFELEKLAKKDPEIADALRAIRWFSMVQTDHLC
ncbi:MAG TPA: hypothetical protein VI874_00900 [Candidatus Norongarragalinales archaeon]|nr:hypothetical protein [Candidatus Norongarragalinales archaeon]